MPQRKENERYTMVDAANCMVEMHANKRQEQKSESAALCSSSVEKGKSK